MHELLEWDMVTVTTSQGLMAYLTAAARIRHALPEYAERIERYFAYCRDNDLRCVQAITDAKGDRRVGPSKQEDPDVYNPGSSGAGPTGIVIRGAKLHISSAAVCHELLVMPTKMMKPGEEEWAVACAVPVSAPGRAHRQHELRAPRFNESDFPTSRPVQHARGVRHLRRRVRAERARIPRRRERVLGGLRARSRPLWERLGRYGSPRRIRRHAGSDFAAGRRGERNPVESSTSRRRLQRW